MYCGLKRKVPNTTIDNAISGISMADIAASATMMSTKEQGQ